MGSPTSGAGPGPKGGPARSPGSPRWPRLARLTRGGRARPRAVGAVALAVAAALALWLRFAGPSELIAPEPERAADPVVAPRPPSTLGVALAVPLPRLVQLLDEALPRTFGSLDERRPLAGRDRTSVAFALERGPLYGRMDGNVARVDALVEYGLRAYYDPPLLPEVSGSCGTGDDPARRLVVALAAPVDLTPDWGLATRARVARVAPATDQDRDRCRVTFLGIDLTDQVVDGAARLLAEHEERVDSIAGAVDLRASFESWWETLREPVPLADSVWLSLTPSAVRKGDVRGEGDTLWVDLGLEAHPAVVLGPRPASADAPLPRLERGEVARGLDLWVDVLGDYDTATRLLDEQVAGTELEHEGRTVVVESVRVFGIGGGRVGLEARVRGDVRARIFLTGTPRLDPESLTVTIPDLDFDVATRNLLVAAASWLQQEDVRRLLRERARWSARPAVAWLEGWLEEGLNRTISSDLRIAGATEAVTPHDAYALRDHFVVRLSARATAQVYVSGP